MQISLFGKSGLTIICSYRKKKLSFLCTHAISQYLECQSGYACSILKRDVTVQMEMDYSLANVEITTNKYAPVTVCA
jgi:hypothetical protein